MGNTELKFEDKNPVKTEAAKESKTASFFKKLKGVKNIEIYIAVIAVLIMVVIYFSTAFTSNAATDNSETSLTAQMQDYCKKMEAEIADALSSLKDAGKAKVVINWESSVESVIAYITNNNSTSSTSTPQIIQNNGSSKPIVLKEIYPKALGVIIICEGGDKPSVKVNIINAVSVLLNITPDKISVFAMNNK